MISHIAISKDNILAALFEKFILRAWLQIGYKMQAGYGIPSAKS
jgi:hypothetical protein